MKTSPENSEEASWAETPERSNLFMLRLMIWLSLVLGRGPTRLVLHLITAYFLLFAPTIRRASSHYLQRVLGRTPRWREVYRHIFTFSATIHDRVFLLNHRFDLFDFEVHGKDSLLKHIADGRGLFLIGAHLGSFEVLRALAWKETNLRITMVMHQENAQKISSMLAAINPDAVQDVIHLGHVESILKVRERLDQGYVVGMLADRTPGNDTLHPVRILGSDTRLPAGPFRIAAMLNRPVLFMTGLYLGGNRYAIHFDPLADFSSTPRSQREPLVSAAIHQYAALLDRYCRAAPYNWFNFFDFWQYEAMTGQREP
jgi:predicted LPLAT superfamily acyltransferase